MLGIVAIHGNDDVRTNESDREQRGRNGRLPAGADVRQAAAHEPVRRHRVQEPRHRDQGAEETADTDYCTNIIICTHKEKQSLNRITIGDRRACINKAH